jgi:penicillin amidase
MLAIQLDDRALYLARWRELLLGTLTPEAVAGSARRRELRRVIEESWTGRASIDSAAYRCVRGFRSTLAREVLGALTSRCRDENPSFDYFDAADWDGPLWRLVTERPPHLLDPRFASWDAALLHAADALLDELLPRDADPATLANRTWGERNMVTVSHPLSRAVPALSRWLDIPPEPLPGDGSVPRVQAPRFGASERMVVSPGREEHGIFHMPGGQSGHPLSPYYRKGHEAWARGEATAFLPGPVEHTLSLHP